MAPIQKVTNVDAGKRAKNSFPTYLDSRHLPPQKKEENKIL